MNPKRGEERAPGGPTGQAKEEQRGIECPRCGCDWLPVVYTRKRPNGTVRRLRECHHCGKRFTTVEAPSGAG